jgi:hypothetical protein
MLPKFEHFIRERLYLHNVTAGTISRYTEPFKWLPSESPSLDELKGMVVRMREKGLKAPVQVRLSVQSILISIGAKHRT